RLLSSVCSLLTRLTSFRSFFTLRPRPSMSTLFPYTTLFRSPGNRPVVPVLWFQARHSHGCRYGVRCALPAQPPLGSEPASVYRPDRKSTRLNSSHVKISYAVFCLKKKTIKHVMHIKEK